MKKIFNKNILTWIITIFIIVQSVCELYYFYVPYAPTILSFSIPTFIRLLFIGIIGIYYLCTTKFSKKHLLLVLYLFIVGIYTVFHHLNALDFKSLVPGDFNYSLFSELFYIIRLLIPWFLLLVMKDVKLSSKQIRIIVISLCVLVSGSIIVSDLFLFGTASYGKSKILGNIFTWFTDGYDKYSYYFLACKGLFHDPNRLSALMGLLLCALLACFYKEKKIVYFILLFLQMIAMCMIGTKVSTYGFGLLLLCFIVIYLFNIIILRKEKLDIKFIIKIGVLLLCYLLLLCFSPSNDRTSSDNNMIDIQSSEEKEDEFAVLNEELDLLIEKNDTESIIAFLYDNSKNYHMNEGFINYYYPIKYDPDFWINIYKMDYSHRFSYRFVEEAMLNRVKEINNNPKDNLLGISFTRHSNIFELERDFKAQYYSIGIIGVIIFFVPYLALLMYIGISIILKLKKRFNVCLIILCVSLVFYLGAAYFSGNVLDGFVTSINYGLLFGFVLNMFKEQNDEN